MSKTNEIDEMNSLMEILKSLSGRPGTAYLLELITHSNQPIHATQLRHLHSLPLLDRPEYSPYHDSCSGRNSTPTNIKADHPFSETSINFCDQRTINEIKKRLNQLQAQKAQARDWNDHGQLDEIYEEEQVLLDYLKKAFKQNGQPRYLRNKAKDDYSYVKTSISRLIDKIREIDPAQANLIEKHLKTGLRFVWDADQGNS